jgi:hypothetical protein
VTFVAVGHNGLRLHSADGARWERGAEGKEGEVYRAVAFGNGRFAAVGNFGGSNLFASTADGAAWETSSFDGQYKYSVRGLSFGLGRFIAIGGDPGSVGSSSPFVVHSDDARKWTAMIPIAGKHILRRIAAGGDRYVGVGDRGRRATSKDGKEWTDATDSKPTDTLIDVVFGAGLFVGAGLHGLRMASEDGLAWKHRFPGEEGEHVNSILRAGDRFVAVGQGATYSSPDGLAWTRKENANAPLVAAWGNGVFVGLAWRGRILRSEDAITWTQVHQAAHPLEAVSFGA